MHTGKSLKNWTKSSLRKSSPRLFQEREVSTKTTRAFYNNKTSNSHNLQILDDKDPTNLKTVHRNHLLEYYPKEESLPSMIEEYVPMDRRHDDFYQRCMEQRTQKLKNTEPSGMEDSLPFPIEPLHTAPVTLPPKRVSNTSSDSGVNSPHVLSPTMPLNPDNSQPYLVPSTSRAIFS